ncbi:MAG: DUF2846 domain-containing protein [Methylococcales bacterium]|jgi:hypothetical protein|nr:DUF2846 domain-containing protein [Methylococcales bacterium]MBT7444121.1 DUF2846 domain-containing protein [Methylococcales bacterium]
MSTLQKLLSITVVFLFLVTGCASVPMESIESTAKAKAFNQPTENKAGIYVYRKDTHFGAAIKKNVYVDQECIGETAKGVFFYHEVDGDKDYTLATESEFSPNDLTVSMKSGMLYFFEQYMKMGVFVGGAGIDQKSEAIGKEALTELNMATKGHCSV